MATQADIPAPICEKLREEGENIVYQATNILLHKLPQEEKTQGDYTPNEPPTIEGEFFVTTPPISEVHYVAKNSSPNASKEDENLNVEVTTSHVETTKEEIPCKEEYIPIEKGDGAVTTPEDPGMLLEDSVSKSEGDVENQSKPVEEIVKNHSNPEVTEKANESSLTQFGDSQVECDEQLEKESEKLPLTEALSEATNGNESTVIHEVKIEDKDLGKAEILENEESTCTLLKEEALQKEPVESLHVAPEDIKASNQGQDTKTSSPEEGSINANVQGTTSDYIDEKSIDTQSEVVEKFPSIVSNEEIEENSLNKVDSPEMKNEEHLEKEIQKRSLPQPLSTEASRDESKVIPEVQVDDGGSKIAELCKNDTSTENIVLKMESKIDEPVESVHISPEDTKASALGQKIEKTSSGEEQTLTAHPQGILDEKTDDRTVDAAKADETLEIQNVATIVSNEKTEEDSLIQVNDSQLRDEDHLEKENEKPQDINDDELSVTHEVKIEEENPKGAELFEREESIESTLLKEEAQIEKPVESFHEALDDIKTSALDQHTETTSSIDENNQTENTHEIPCDEAEDKTIDVADTKEEILQLQDVAVNASNKDVDDDAIIQVDDSQLKHEEHLEEEIGKPSIIEALAKDANNESTTVHEVKFETEEIIESKKPSFIQYSTLDVNDDELTVTREVKIEEENPKGAELLEREDNIESTLLKEEAQIEKPVESFHEALDGIKASALDQHTEITSSTDENSQTENTHEIPCDEAEEKTIDVADTKEEILQLQDAAVNVSNKDVDEDALIQVDNSQPKHEEPLEEEIGKPSIIEALAEDANDESTTVHEVKFKTDENIESALLEREAVTEKPIEYLQVADEDNKPSATSDTVIAGFLEEQSQIANSQSIVEDKALDAIEKQEVTLENVETIVAHEDVEENPVNHVDCSQMEYEEHLEKEIENPFLKDSSTGDTKEDESKTLREPEIRDEDLIKAELLENEKNIETTLEKDEALIEKSIESLPTAIDDIKASASGQDTETSSIEDKIPTLNPQEVFCSETEEKTIDAADIKDETLVIENVARDVPNDKIDKNSSIPLEGSQIEHEVHFEKEIEKPSFTEAPIEAANDDGTFIIKEANIENARLRNVELFDDDTNIDNSLLNKETTVEKPIEEQIENAQGIVGEKIIDATEEVAPEVENVATLILHGETQENSLSQVDCSQTKYEEYLEKESENPPSLEESSTGDKNEAESKAMHEPEIRDEKLIKAELLENEKNTEITLEKEETLTEQSIDIFQVATKDIEASASGQETETSSIDEQIPTVKPQEIFCGETEEKTIHAADAKDETLVIENVAINVPNEDIDENSSIQVNDSQIEPEAHMENQIEKPSLINATTKSTTNDASIIVRDAEIGNACLGKVELFDNENNIDNALLEENAPVEKPIADLHVAAEDSKEFVSSEDTKATYSLEEQMANAQGTVDEKTIHATEEVTREIKNVPHEETQENSPIQVDCPQMEYEEILEKESENPSLAEASTGNTNEDDLKAMHEPEIGYEELIKAQLKENDENAESTLVKEEGPMENPIDSLQVATEDIKVSASDQETEASHIHEQIPIVNPKEISSDKTEEKTIDAVDTEKDTLEVQIVLTNVASGDNENISVNEIDGSKLKHEEHFEKESENPSVAEASTDDNNDDKSTVHEVKSENQKNTGSTLVKEASIESLQVAPEVIKESDSSQDRETSSLEEQCLTVTPQEIKDDNKVDETYDATQVNEETSEDKIVAIDVANDDTEENILIQVDGPQIKSKTHMEMENEKLDGNANDESKIMHEASTLEEGLRVEDKEFFTAGKDNMKDAANQEKQDNPITSTENDSNDIVDQVKEEKVDEDSEITVRSDDVEMQMTDNQHHVEAHSEAKEDETIKISSEVVEIYEESNDNTGKSTETNNKEIKVEASNKDEKIEMEPESEVSKETENDDNNAKTTKINEEEGYLKDLQMATAVDIADHEENGSVSITAENLCTKGSDVDQDTVVTVVEGPNCEQEESSNADVSEQDTSINNENVINTINLACEASNVNSEKTDVENMGELNNVSVIKPAIENLVEAYQKESTEAQVPDGEKEAEPDAEIGEKEIKDEQPINASPDVSESNESNGEEENKNSDSVREISDNPNTVELEEDEIKETQKQHDDHILAHINNLSTGKTEDDIPLCGAPVDESDIPEQLKNIGETSLPAADENIIEKIDSNKIEVAEDAKDKYVEHLERDLTINREVMHIDKTVSGEDEEVEANKQNITDLSPAAPVTTEAKLLYEAPEVNFTCKVAGEGNISNETIDTTESTVMNNNTDLEDTHANSKSIEELDTKLEDNAPEVKETTSDATKGQEVEVENVWESSALLSERAESQHAFVGGIEERSNSVEFKDEDVKELKSPVQAHHTEEGVTRDNKTVDETTCASVEKVIEDNITSVQEDEIQKAVLFCNDQETSLEIEKSKDESTSKMRGVEEKSMELGQEGSLKDEEILNCKVDDTIDSNIVSEEIHDPEKLEKNLESIAQVEICDKIPKAEEVETEEENLEAADDIKFDKIVSEQKIEPKETIYEAEEIMKVDILSEKIEIEKDGDDAQEHHLGSCKEEVFRESHLEDEIKQEEQIYTKEDFEVIKNASENVKECKVIEEASDKTVEEPEDTLPANESIKTIHQKEQIVSVEEITTVLDTDEAARGSDHVWIKTETEGSSEEVNSSDVAVLDDENNRTGADELLKTEMTKDEGLPNEDSKNPEIDAIAGELTKLDKNIICEDAPTTAVHIIIKESEGDEEYVNANIMQQQAGDNKSKHESLPLPEFTQGKETEKQDEKDENCTSDEVQAKEEVRTCKKEEQKVDTCSKPTESTKSLNPKCSQEEYPKESTESQISTFNEDVELIEQASKATTTDAAAVLQETGRDSQPTEKVSDECEGMKTSPSIESTEISKSNIIEDYTVGTSLWERNQETQDQLTKLHDLPQEPDIKDCEVKMAEKDDQVSTQSVSDVRENVQDLNEGSIEVSKDENDFPQESQVKDSEPEMAEKDGPMDLQCVSDIREDVQELNETSVKVSKEENPVVADPSENIEAKCSGGGQEADAVRNSPISETIKQEIEEHPISEANGMKCEEKNIDANYNDITETSHIVTKEMVTDTKTHPNYMEDVAKSEGDHESQPQINSLPILPSIKCSDTEIAEKDDVKEEVTRLPAKDTPAVPEADHIENVNPKIDDSNILVMQDGASIECPHEESEILRPSIPEQGEAKCDHEEKSSEKSESTEMDKSSLSDLLQVSSKETSKTAGHSANENKPTIQGEYLHVEKPNETEHEETKTDEEKDNEEESCEQKTSDLGSEAPVIVDAGDADVKVHKKSHNILSGVGSKVKHSIAKVKKVITGKSSHPKPPSPKSGEKC